MNEISICNIVDGTVICISVIFFFVCFVVVLVGGGSNYSAALGEPYSEVGIYAVDALLVLNVIIEGFAEDATYDCQHSRVKMGVSMRAFVRPHKRRFDGETVD